MPSLSKEVRDALNSGIDLLLSDGKWHDLCEFIPICNCVPAEVASRFYAAENTPETVAKKPIHEQVLRGRRRVLEHRLVHRARFGVAEVEGSGFNKKYRLVPKNNLTECAAVAVEKIVEISKQLPEDQRQMMYALVASQLDELTKGLLQKIVNAYLENHKTMTIAITGDGTGSWG